MSRRMPSDSWVSRSSPTSWTPAIGPRGSGLDPTLLAELEVALRWRGHGDLVAEGPVADGIEHERGEGEHECRREDEQGQADRRRAICPEAPQGRPQPDHRQPSRARRTVPIRTAESWRVTIATVTTRRMTARTTSGTSAAQGIDDDRRGDRRRTAGGQRRERQDEPGEEQPEQDADGHPEAEERRVLEGQPAGELAVAQPERLEERELAHPLVRRDRRTHDEPDRRERQRREGAEGQRTDQCERDRVAR